MHDRRAGRVRFERRIGDLARRDRNRRMLADRVAGAGDGAGDDDVRRSSFPLAGFDDFAPRRPAAQGFAARERHVQLRSADLEKSWRKRTRSAARRPPALFPPREHAKASAHVPAGDQAHRHPAGGAPRLARRQAVGRCGRRLAGRPAARPQPRCRCSWPSSKAHRSRPRRPTDRWQASCRRPHSVSAMRRLRGAA